MQAVADAVGFRDRFDPELKQFLHPAGIVFATPAGIVSSYLLGVGYRARRRAARRDARRAAAASRPRHSPVLLLCFHFDPTTGRYTLAIMKLLRLAAAITVVDRRRHAVPRLPPRAGGAHELLAPRGDAPARRRSTI